MENIRQHAESIILGTATTAEVALGILAETTEFRTLLPAAIGDHASNFLVTIPLVLAGYSLVSSKRMQAAFIRDLPEKMRATTQKYQQEIFNTLKIVSLAAITFTAFHAELAGMNVGQFFREGLSTELAIHEILPDLAFGFVGMLTSLRFVDSLNRESTT